MSQVWEYSETEGSERLVMLALADFCDDEGFCFPGITRIAKKCRISERTVQRIISSLIERGEVKRKSGEGLRVCGDRGVGHTNLYQLIIKKGCQSVTPLPNNSSIGVTSKVDWGDIAVSPKPSGESSGEIHTLPIRAANAPSGTLFEDEEFPEVSTTSKPLKKSGKKKKMDGYSFDVLTSYTDAKPLPFLTGSLTGLIVKCRKDADANSVSLLAAVKEFTEHVDSIIVNDKSKTAFVPTFYNYLSKRLYMMKPEDILRSGKFKGHTDIGDSRGGHTVL